MTNHRHNSYTCDSNMTGVFLSLIFGGLAGILFYFGFLPTITFGVIVATVTAVVALILFWTAVVCRRYSSDNDCICESYGTLIAGIIGTLITAAAVLSLSLEIFATFSAVVIGLVAFFFALTLSGIVSFLGCKADCDFDCDCN